jgi:hypothetical protein
MVIIQLSLMHLADKIRDKSTLGQQIQLFETGTVMAVHKVVDIKEFTDVYVFPNTHTNICATSRLTAMEYTVFCGPANQHWIMKKGWKLDNSPYLVEVLRCETLQGRAMCR